MALYVSALNGGSNNHPTTSEEANGYATDFVNEGIVGSYTNTNSVAPMTGAFAVNAQGTPDMTVAVTSGVAYVDATPSGQAEQSLRVRLSANQNVTISANSSGSTKYDWVYIKIDPTNANNPNLAGDDVATLVTSRSTSNTSDDGTPPTYGILLAVVTVANGASTITNGNIRDVRVQASSTSVDTAITTGWIRGGLPAVSTVTYLGNRSYDVVFGSTVASTLTPGMRLELTKTVAGNGYMGGAFNGSSHYFTKTSPTGTLGTVTNNFTIEAVVQPTSYQDACICGRADATAANALFIYMTSSGTVTAGVRNGAVGNYRYIQTYQSLPLNKKTHVAASWTGGTVVIYFDGISVPVQAAVTAGTNPTTAGAAGDFSVGRLGGNSSLYFPGYISNVAVFDAVLSAATIRQHATYKLTGSETNCIGAWSLDNTANDQSSAGNNLTATGGVGYTAQTPHGQLDSGVQTTKAVALVMNVSTTTATVQVPEGVTIPTTGGITSVSYSTQANPYGWVSDVSKWGIATILYADTTYTIGSSGSTYLAFNALQITPPKGAWRMYAGGSFSWGVTSAGTIFGRIHIAAASGATTILKTFRRFGGVPHTGSGTYDCSYQVEDEFDANGTTDLSMRFRMESGGGTLTVRHVGSTMGSQSFIALIPSGL